MTARVILLAMLLGCTAPVESSTSSQALCTQEDRDAGLCDTDNPYSSVQSIASRAAMDEVGATTVDNVACYTVGQYTACIVRVPITNPLLLSYVCDVIIVTGPGGQTEVSVECHLD